MASLAFQLLAAPFRAGLAVTFLGSLSGAFLWGYTGAIGGLVVGAFVDSARLRAAAGAWKGTVWTWVRQNPRRLGVFPEARLQGEFNIDDIRQGGMEVGAVFSEAVAFDLANARFELVLWINEVQSSATPVYMERVEYDPVRGAARYRAVVPDALADADDVRLRVSGSDGKVDQEFTETFPGA